MRLSSSSHLMFPRQVIFNFYNNFYFYWIKLSASRNIILLIAPQFHFHGQEEYQDTSFSMGTLDVPYPVPPTDQLPKQCHPMKFPAVSQPETY